MSDLCISLNEVKPGFRPAVDALDIYKDGRACKSENPEISGADFNAFVYAVRYKPVVSEAPAVESDGTEIELPVMADIPGMPGKAIMRREVSVGLFAQVMEGYEFTGQGADELLAILGSPQANEPVSRVSLDDAREFAVRLSELTGRQFMVQTVEEAEAAEERGLLAGVLHATWTETLQHDVIAKEDRNALYKLGEGAIPNFGYKPSARIPHTTDPVGIRLVEIID